MTNPEQVDCSSVDRVQRFADARRPLRSPDCAGAVAQGWSWAALVVDVAATVVSPAVALDPRRLPGVPRRRS